jgi:hypothetical protein
MEALCCFMNAVAVVITIVEAKILLLFVGPCSNIVIVSTAKESRLSAN